MVDWFPTSTPGTDSIKAKKTDLPVLPPSIEQQSDVLPGALDDLGAEAIANAEDADADDEDNDDDLDDDESDEDMMADDPSAAGNVGGLSSSAVGGVSSVSDPADDDYDSDEDDESAGTGGSAADRSGNFGSGTANQEDVEDDGDDDSADDDGADDRWDSGLPDMKQMPTIKEVTSTALPTSTDLSDKSAGQKSTDDKSSAAAAASEAAAAAVDPYFTHFDPRAEHQSYKVKVRALSQYICTPMFRCGPSQNGMPMDFLVFFRFARLLAFATHRTLSSGLRKRIARR